MKKSILFFIFINVYLAGYNQVIKGTIYDSKTKSIIYSASVYFTGTLVGTLSDQNGNFQIDISKYRSMPLTISAIGYYSVTLTDLTPGKPLLVYMNPKVFELNEVVVKARPNVWKRRENLTIFRNEFLGKSANAMNCEIINENDIRFTNSSDNDTVKAYAINPLIINNKALGYKITYYLDKFEYYKQSTTFFFRGNIIFMEDSTSSATEKEYFGRKRKAAYLGSRMHFFRALWVDDLNSAGFGIKNSANETLGYKKIVYQKDSHTKYLKYHGTLGISYLAKNPASFVTFLKEQVYFDANGYFDPSGITWEGDMAKQRIADLLPFEYSVN